MVAGRKLANDELDDLPAENRMELGTRLNRAVGDSFIAIEDMGGYLIDVSERAEYLITNILAIFRGMKRRDVTTFGQQLVSQRVKNGRRCERRSSNYCGHNKMTGAGRGEVKVP